MPSIRLSLPLIHKCTQTHNSLRVCYFAFLSVTYHLLILLHFIYFLFRFFPVPITVPVSCIICFLSMPHFNARFPPQCHVGTAVSAFIEQLAKLYNISPYSFTPRLLSLFAVFLCYRRPLPSCWLLNRALRVPHFTCAIHLNRLECSRTSYTSSWAKF